MIKSRGSAYIF